MKTGQILMMIAAFLLLTVGSFVWYVATWDERKGQDSVDLNNNLTMERALA